MCNVFNGAKWIGVKNENLCPIIKKSFDVNSIKKATLYITGLGYYEAKINGKKITDYMLLPIASDYEKKDLSRDSYYYKIKGTTGQSRIYYDVFDVTDKLTYGKNQLTVELANGWYTLKHFGDELKTIFKLVIETETGETIIKSDGTETWTDGEIRYNNIFIGEVIDPSQKSGEEKPVLVLEDTLSLLTLSDGAPDKIIRKITPTFLYEKNGKKIYDLNESISGLVKIKTSAKKGSEIVLRFTELLDDNGELLFNFGVGAEWAIDGKPQIMEDRFVCDGTSREFMPKFVWHAFRYFDIEGDFDSLEVVEIHSDTPITSTFESDSEGLNFLYNSFISTQLGNMHGSFPSDCPHRERIGYTGDGQVCSTAGMIMLDSKNFYRKWIRDITDCQMEDGFVHHTAPYYSGAGGPGIWGSSIVYVPYYYYLQYGEESMLRETYLGMKKWIKYLTTCLEDGVITHEVESSLSLGDWAQLGGVRLKSKFVNTCCFIKVLKMVSKIATIIGETDDIIWYDQLKSVSEKAVKDNFLDQNGITYLESVQGADVFAVWCGVAGKDTILAIRDKYKDLGYFDTGFMGTDLLLDVLFENGYEDIAFSLLESRKMGTFLYMKDNGATTLWENWDGGRMSRFHPMFGGCSRHIFSSILGIRNYGDSVGYKKIVIDPRAPKNMNYAKGSFLSPYGKISVSWKRVNGKTQVDYTVPDGVEVIK